MAEAIALDAVSHYAVEGEIDDEILPVSRADGHCMDLSLTSISLKAPGMELRSVWLK